MLVLCYKHMSEWEQWVDSWLVHLRNQGVSAGTLERRAKLLGQVAAQGGRPKSVNEVRVFIAFGDWVKQKSNKQ